MTQDEIMKMAREAGLHIATDVNWMPIISLGYAERFANLVAQHEREACAKACYEEANKHPIGLDSWLASTHCAQAIEARGQA
jgi:hypothetical protein